MQNLLLKSFLTYKHITFSLASRGETDFLLRSLEVIDPLLVALELFLELPNVTGAFQVGGKEVNSL